MRYFTQNKLLYFAARGPRHFVDGFQSFWKILTREIMRFEERNHGIQCQCALAGERYKQTSALSEPFVGHRDQGGVRDLRYHADKSLDLVHGNVFTASDDDILDAPDNPDVSLFVHPCQITGIKPTVFIDVV